MPPPTTFSTLRYLYPQAKDRRSRCWWPPCPRPPPTAPLRRDHCPSEQRGAAECCRPAIQPTSVTAIPAGT
eukprot:3938910-Rhodomonas_salina.11